MSEQREGLNRGETHILSRFMEDGSRRVHIGVCWCGWVGPTRSDDALVTKDVSDHVDEVHPDDGTIKSSLRIV